MIGLGLSLTQVAARRRSAAVSYDAAASALFAAMSVQPSGARKAIDNTFILALKAATLWDKSDVYYVTAAHDEQAARLNWKNPSTFSLSANGAPVFAVDRGYKGDGTAAYLSSAYNPTTFGGAHQLNSAVIGAWVQAASTVNSSMDLYTGTGRIGLSSTGTTVQGRINDAASMNIGAAAPAAGHYTMRRTLSIERSGWVSGVNLGSNAQVSTANATSFVLLGTGSANFSNGRIAAAYAGGGFTDADMAAMHSILANYMTAVGAA